MTSHELARFISQKALEKKAHDIIIMDLKGLSDVADFFVLCTGDSDTHVKAISDWIDDELRRSGNAPWKTEGTQKLLWVLHDFVDVVVHIFQPSVREFYSLERLWGDAAIERVVDNEAPPTFH